MVQGLAKQKSNGWMDLPEIYGLSLEITCIAADTRHDTDFRAALGFGEASQEAAYRQKYEMFFQRNRIMVQKKYKKMRAFQPFPPVFMPLRDPLH